MARAANLCRLLGRIFDEQQKAYDCWNETTGESRWDLPSPQATSPLPAAHKLPFAVPRQTPNFRLQQRTSCDLIAMIYKKVPFEDVALATEETMGLRAVADFDYEFLRVSALAESITGSSVHMLLNLQGDRRITTRRPEERSCAAMAPCNPFV